MRGHVADRKHHPAAKSIVQPAALLALADQVDRPQHGRRVRRWRRPVEQPLPIVGRIADAPRPHALGRDAALFDIPPRDGPLVPLQQALMKLFRRPFQSLVERLLVVGTSRRDLGLRNRRQLNAGAIGEHLDRFAKADPLALHDEAENVAADVADPALPRLPFGIDLQAGPRVVVPGAERHIVPPLPAQFQVATHQVGDIHRLPDAFLGVVVSEL
jgi:hypothetical protein